MNIREPAIKTFKVTSDNFTQHRPRDADADREFAVEHPVHFRTDKHPTGFDRRCAHLHVGLHSLLGSLAGLRISSAAEKLSIGRTQVEDRNTPVPPSLICVVYRYPAGRYCALDRHACGKRLIELMAEGNRALVENRELIGDHRRNLALHECRCNTAPDTDTIAAAGVAAGEYGQTDPLPTQVDAHLFGIDALVFECEIPGARIGPGPSAHLSREVTVTSKVKDASAGKQRLQLLERCMLAELELNPFETAQRLAKELHLSIEIQLRQAFRPG